MKPAWLPFFFGVALGGAACDAAPDSAPVSKAAGELPARSRVVPIEKAIDVRRVSWPRVDEVDDGVAQNLSADVRQAVARSSLPVLVPRALGLVDRTVLIVRDNFYAASIHGSDDYAGLTVNVSATRVTHRYRGMPNVKGRDRVRGDRPAFVTSNEGIWSATWIENGVSYVVEVECAHPSEDARCADSTFVERLADELAFVGGSFAEGGAQ